MSGCCDSKTDTLAILRSRQATVLKWLLAINTAMFFIEASAGVFARSTALLADSADMFGDAAVYALTLYVIHRGAVWRARAALAKGLVMAALGVGVAVQAAVALATSTVPAADAMGLIGALALAANLTCVALLYRHRSDDLNMRSTWLCSRNDIIANTGVLAAAGAVAILGSTWPDVLVGGLIAALFLKDAIGICRDARAELASARAG